MDPKKVREKYDAFAPSYDWAEGFLEVLLGIKRMRRNLLKQPRVRCSRSGLALATASVNTSTTAR